MKRRQTMPRQWLIVNDRPDDTTWNAVARLSLGSGVLLLCELHAIEQRRLRQIASRWDLVVAQETPRTAVRVHDVRELTRALLRRAPLILVSPLYPTSSHPDWKPLPRMRAATLARMAKRRAIALGGMNEDRYAKVAPLGFTGWAGISAFRT